MLHEEVVENSVYGRGKSQRNREIEPDNSNCGPRPALKVIGKVPIKRDDNSLLMMGKARDLVVGKRFQSDATDGLHIQVKYCAQELPDSWREICIEQIAGHVLRSGRISVRRTMSA